MPLALKKIIHDGQYISLRSVQQVPLIFRDGMRPTSGTVVVSISLRKMLRACCHESQRRPKNDERTARKRGAGSTTREKKDQARGSAASVQKISLTKKTLPCH